MLTTPTTITIDGTGHILSKIREDNFQSVYRKIDTNLQIDLNIRHSFEGKTSDKNRMARHNVELVYTSFAVDGTPTTHSAYIVLRAPQSLGNAPLVKSAAGLLTWLTAATNANLSAIASWES